MSELWFNNDDDTTKDFPCFCDFCTSPTPNARQDLAPYWRAGLKLKEGTKVSLVTVKQAMQIAMKKVENLHQPAKLETLCGRVVRKHTVNGDCKFLPLPQLIKERVWFGEYDEEADGNFAEDYTFTRTAKNIVSMLWNHLGCTIIRSRRHPMHRF